MQIFYITDYQYLIHLKRRYSWRKFRQKAKVISGTYSETFARKIYSSVFEYSTDLRGEFQKYYVSEYENINQYLFWRYGISEEIIDQIKEIKNSYLAIFNFDWQIGDDEILKESIIQLFREMDGAG